MDFLKLYFHPSIHLFFYKVILILFIYFFLPHRACGILVPQPGSEPPAVGVLDRQTSPMGQILHRICLYNAKSVYLAMGDYVLLSQNIDYCSNSVPMWLSIMFITQHKDDVKNHIVQWYRDFKEERVKTRFLDAVPKHQHTEKNGEN